MKKAKKLIFIILIIILSLLLIIVFASRRKQQTIKTKFLLEELENIEEVVIYMESKYIKEEKSKGNFEKDIYVEFSKKLYENSESQEEYYNKFIEMLANKMNYRNFRIIDDKQQIVIAVICSDNIVQNIYINGNDNYFGRILSMQNIEKIDTTKITEFSVEAKELLELINNNWITKNVSLGSKDSSFDDYDIYFDEGIEVKTIQKKVYNIVFTHKYLNNIVNGLKVGIAKENITKILGDATFKNDKIIGYKGKDFYIFFAENEVSIYRIENFNSEDISKLILEFSENKNIKKFISNITDVWKDYNFYNYDTDFVNLKYTLKGINFEFNVSNDNGIILYNNFYGKIIDNKTILELKENMPNYIYFRNEDSVWQEEVSRNLKNEEIYSKENSANNNFRIIAKLNTDGFSSIQIVSLNKEYPNTEILKNRVISSYLWKSDYELLYGIKNKGIYLYNVIEKTTQMIKEGNDKFILKTIQNDILKYDDTEIKI